MCVPFPTRLESSALSKPSNRGWPVNGDPPALIGLSSSTMGLVSASEICRLQVLGRSGIEHEALLVVTGGASLDLGSLLCSCQPYSSRKFDPVYASRLGPSRYSILDAKHFGYIPRSSSPASILILTHPCRVYLLQ